jgi:peptidyl-prolyl cis-trans isomerase C
MQGNPTERKAMRLRILAAALAAFSAAALAQAPALPAKGPAKPAAAPASKDGPVATVNGVVVPQARMDFMMQQQAARGTPDNPQVRAQLREELINREILQQEAVRTGIAKKGDVQTQLELARQEIIVQAYLRDYIGKHPVSDAEVQKEYDRAKAQTGATEYKARHILVDTEDEAKRVIAEIKKGGKFEELAQKHSKDSNKDRGGDLDWNVPGIYDKAFADALVKLEKGRMTESPVQTRFGFHVIQLDDVRPVKFPALAEVKGRIQQRLAQSRIERLVGELRAKAKVE